MAAAEMYVGYDEGYVTSRDEPGQEKWDFDAVGPAILLLHFHRWSSTATR